MPQQTARCRRATPNPRRTMPANRTGAEAAPLPAGPERRPAPGRRGIAAGERKKEKPKASAFEPRRSWFDQLRSGLARTSSAFSDNLASVITKRKLDDDMLDRLEEVLIKADLGVAMAARIRSRIASGRYERGVDHRSRCATCSRLRSPSVLEPLAQDFALNAAPSRMCSWWSASTAPARPPPSARWRIGCRRRLERHARRRRHVPRRRDRSAQSLGRARRRRGGRQAGRRRSGGRRLRGVRARPRRRDRRAA